MSIQLPQEPEFRVKWEEAQGSFGLYAERFQLSLWVAVPLEMEVIRNNGGPHSYEIEWLHNYVDELCARGDDLLFGAKRRGEATKLFQRFAYALALLSFAPGGVQIAGMHFVGHRLEE